MVVLDDLERLQRVSHVNQDYLPVVITYERIFTFVWMYFYRGNGVILEVLSLFNEDRILLLSDSVVHLKFADGGADHD